MIGTSFTVGEEATDYANVDFDNEKFLELKGVDSVGEYLDGLIFDSALNSGSMYAESKVFDYDKGFKEVSRAKC